MALDPGPGLPAGYTLFRQSGLSPSFRQGLAREIPPSDYRFLRIGHRGAAAHAPDNTLLGIRQAAELGADLVEMDVRQIADGQVVLSHEDHYADASGRIHFVEHSRLAELQAIDLGQGERIPTLAQAIELCQQEQLGAYIELKDGRCVSAVVDIIHQRKFADQCIVASFRPDWMAEAKAIAPSQACQDLARVYALLNRADHLEADYHAGAHRFSGSQAFAFLDRWLVEGRPSQKMM